MLKRFVNSKVMLVISVFILVFFGIGIFNKVFAQSCTCANWRYDSWPCTVTDASGNSVSGFCSSATCTDFGNSCQTGNCSPGEYPCNRPSNCCPMGTPPPPVTGGGGGGCTSGCGTCTSGCGGCEQTAPTGLSAARVDSTSADLTWTPGTPGGSNPYQALYVSTNSNPQTGCAGTSGGTAACPVKRDTSTTPLDETVNQYSITSLLTPNTVYYWQVLNVQDGTCTSYTNAPIYVSSCSVSPSSITMNQGDTQILTSSLTSGNDVVQVNFTSSDVSKVTVSPASDASYSYQTTLTGVAVTSPTVNITEDVIRTGGTIACSQSTTVTVLPSAPWWQVKDSDVSSSTTLDSNVPSGQYFNLAGAGGFPGIPAYVTSTNMTNLNVSQLGWLAQSTETNKKVYDYQYLINQVPADTQYSTLSSNVFDQAALDANVTPSYGYYWYMYDGETSGLDMVINSNLNVGSKKVILMIVSANLDISGRINLTDGQGYFMAVVGHDDTGTAKGNITVNPALGGNPFDLEGIYIASGTFSTGAAATTLKVRGSVVGYQGMNLQRDLGSTNSTTPAEYFEYAPDQILLYPSTLGARKINWKEVSP